MLLPFPGISAFEALRWSLGLRGALPGTPGEPIQKNQNRTPSARRRESYIHEYFKPSYLRHGVRLELLDVLVEQQGPRAVLLVALEAWSDPYFPTELEERAPLVQRDARRGGRLEEL